MDVCDFLSKKKNYDALVRKAMRVIKDHSREEAYDIAAEALVHLFDKFKREPESLVEVEKKGEDDMRKFLEVCLIRRVFTLLKKENRTRIKIAISLAEAFEEEEKKRNIFSFRIISDTSIKVFKKFKKRFGIVKVKIDKFKFDTFREDLDKFLKAKYGNEKRKLKEEAIDLYIERFQKNLTIPQLQELYPEKKVASLNSEASRLIKNYLGWLKNKGISNLFNFEEINGRGSKNAKR